MVYSPIVKKPTSIDKRLKPIEEKDENEVMGNSQRVHEKQKKQNLENGFMMFKGMGSSENFCSSQEIMEAFENNGKPKRIMFLNYNDFSGNIDRKNSSPENNKAKFQTLIKKIALGNKKKQEIHPKQEKISNKSMKFESSTRKLIIFEIFLIL